MVEINVMSNALKQLRQVSFRSFFILALVAVFVIASCVQQQAQAATTSVNDTVTGTGFNQFNYSGTWTSGTQTGAYLNNIRHATASGAYYTFKFSGTQAKVYSEKSAGVGIMAISIDGGAETMVDPYAATASYNALVYTSPILTNGTHTVKVRNTGTKNAAAWGTYLIADRIDITSGTTTPPSGPSGQPMPVGNLTGWTQIFSDDFTSGNVALGSFPGSYSAKWDDGYPDGTPDTAGLNHGTPSQYAPSKVLSIQDGVMDMYLHTENGQALGAAPGPILPGKSNAFSGQQYGRYTVRFKSDASIWGYKTAWLLWPDSYDWEADGEVDFPEANLDLNIGAYMHHTDSDGETSDGYVSSTPMSGSGWHTATMEWSPSKFTFYLDGVHLGTSTQHVPDSPMHYLLQTESCQGYDPADPENTAGRNPCPAATASGHVQIDWIAIYSYTP